MIAHTGIKNERTHLEPDGAHLVGFDEDLRGAERFEAFLDFHRVRRGAGLVAAYHGDGAELEHDAQLDDDAADCAGGAVENHCEGSNGNLFLVAAETNGKTRDWAIRLNTHRRRRA